jgi:hypothetical protein
MALKFLHTPKPKQFNFGYRFYDPQKEAMKEREERIRRELAIDDNENTGGYYRAGIKGQFRKAAVRPSKTSAAAIRKSNMRLVYIVIILSILFYILLK